MKKTHAITTAALAALASATGMVASVTNASADVTTRWNGAPETREEDRRFHVNGRFMYDLAFTDADCANTACTGVNESGVRGYARRAFLGVDGRLTEHWRYNAKFDFSIGGSVNVDDMYLEYAGDTSSWLFGNHNAISPMEDRDSSLNIPFNERSFLITAGGFGKRPGVGFLTNGGNWSWGAALQGADSLSTGDTAANGQEAYFGISRFTWAPIYQSTPEGTTLLHLGVTGRYRDIGDGAGNVFNNTLSLSPSGLSNRQSNNAAVGAFESDTYLGFEAAFQLGAFGAEAEYGHFSTSDAPGGSQLGDADADGYYIDLFWSPTGESRSYKASDGSFGSIRPRRTLGSDGGIGHVMLSARYENMDLSDANFGANRNETSAVTLGATWVPVEHVKFQLNYSQTEIDYVTPDVPGTRVDNEIDAVTLRTQFDW
ncbi:MAG: hypothetical protein KF779_02985 [Hyphomonadaceae bacterium]|nr:hypothetical protein [Hyphomonadaceae bacterium]